MERGEIYYADLGQNMGSEQSGIRLVLIVQNNMGNEYSPTTIICPLTSQEKTSLPTHVYLPYGTPKPSLILAEQIRTISKKRIFDEKLVCKLNTLQMHKVDEALKASLQLE